jgi:purine-cytosine permease-like protein
MNRYGDFLTAFLTAIGSVFLPVYAVVFLDFFTLKKEDKEDSVRRTHIRKLAVAAAGVICYQILLKTGAPAPTVITLIVTSALFAGGRCLRYTGEKNDAP